MQTSNQVAPNPAMPNEIICPICATHFDPRASGGRCPVCNEQVIPQAAVSRFVPMLTPAWAWLKAGGWRLALLVAFVLYQIGLFIYMWHSLANAHVL
ncbi:MAG: hypothetical protein ACM3N4_06210 [Nitrososphaerota archaeon]